MDNQQPSIKRGRGTCKNAKKFTVEAGKIYGTYEALEEVIVQNKKSIERRWKCRHIYSNKTTVSRPSYLIQVQKRYNDKLKSGKSQTGLINYMFRNYQSGAKNRNHIFDLSQDEFNNIIFKDCHYCGEPPKESSIDLINKRGNMHQAPIFYNGIDRVDSSEGYNISNCVPCCADCNYMKNVMSQSKFLNHISKIYYYQNNLNKGSTTIPSGSTLQVNGSGNRKHLNVDSEDEDIVCSA